MKYLKFLIFGLFALGGLSAAYVWGDSYGKKIAPIAKFYMPPEDAGAALPKEGFYPKGRKMVFMGYSGVPERDLANGFTVAGPVYGNQEPYLKQCAEHGWPVVAHVGLKVTFEDENPNRYKLDEATLRPEVANQVRELAGQKNIIWWAVGPEELRPWRGDEMRYLEIVCEEIRANDPEKRPVFLYNPNHRTGQTLEPIAKCVDIMAKGAYVNTVGKKRERSWVRWSIEQEIQAIAATGRPGAIPLVMPELCQDPELVEDDEIPAWVRHDVYLGMASGAKGVNIWSLFKRDRVKRTYALWYDAYAQCAKELEGGLSQVFLFGERRNDFQVKPLEGAGESDLEIGGDAEPLTSSEEESAKRKIAFPAWTKAEFAYGSSRYVFLIHSGNESGSYQLSGWPKGSAAENVFDKQAEGLPSDGKLTVDLPAYGVMALRFYKP